MKQDKLIIGGHEFDSRFILGSGKYSLDLINAAVQNAGAQIITLALRRTTQMIQLIFLTIFQKVSHFFQIHLEQEMQKKQFVLQDLQEK